MAGDDRGPLERIRDDELIWLGPSPPLAGIVAVDLDVLRGADSSLRRSADTIAHSGLGSDEHALDGLLDELVGGYGGFDGAFTAGDLDQAQRGLSDFKDDLDERHDTLEP